jgi:hypothetical protein
MVIANLPVAMCLLQTKVNYPDSKSNTPHLFAHKITQPNASKENAHAKAQIKEALNRLNVSFEKAETLAEQIAPNGNLSELKAKSTDFSQTAAPSRIPQRRLFNRNPKPRNAQEFASKREAVIQSLVDLSKRTTSTEEWGNTHEPGQEHRMGSKQA